MAIRPLVARAETLRPLAAAVLWSTYVVAPTRGWAWLDGVPIGPLEAAALGTIWWTWAVRRRLPGARIASLLLLVKLVLGAAAVDRGFEARYYANGTWTPPIELSTEFRGEPFTRRDARLSFGEGEPDLPLYFLNDLRFNFHLPTQPQRERLPYSVTWDGFLFLEQERPAATLYLSADDAAAGALSIDGRTLIVLDRTSPRTASTRLEPGWHALRLAVAAPQGAARRVAAGDVADGTLRPFDASRVLPRPYGPLRLRIDDAVRSAARFIDAVVLLWMAGLVILRVPGLVRERRLGRLLWLGAIAEALWYAAPHAGRVETLSGGNDWLTYEHYARAIALGDVLLRLPGLGDGQGAPFYYQPLYPYVVALAHVVFGEDLFGIVLVQRLLVAGTVAWASAITARLFGARVGWIAVLGGGWFLYSKLGRWSYVLLAEPFFAPIFVAWTWLLVMLATGERSRPRLVLAGVVGGIATLARSTLLLAWPVILPLWGISLRGRRMRTVAILAGIMAALVGVATLRNWIVGMRFVLVTTSFGINLLLGNQPPRAFAPPTTRTAIYERFQLDDYTRTVAEYAIQAPADFAANMGRKAIYAVGLYDLSGLNVYAGTAPSYAGIWLLAIIGAFRVRRARVIPASPTVWLPLTLAMCHYVAVVLIFPWGYGDRLIVPLYPLLIPYAALALAPLVQRVEPSGRRAGIAVASMVTRVRRWFLPEARHVFIRTADWTRAQAAGILKEGRNWTWIAYTAAVFHWLQGLEVATALLLPLAALLITRATRNAAVHRGVGSVAWTAALLRILAAGSLSADAVHDPLFWAAAATVLLIVSAVTGRWPTAAGAFAAIAGACTMTAILQLLFPDFQASFPAVTPAVASESLTALLRRLGPFGTVGLLAVWLQGIAGARVRGTAPARVTAGARGALLVALVLAFAGAVPEAEGDPRLWLVTLGVLLGLVEARARPRAAI